MDEWLTTSDGNNRRATFLNRVNALLHGESPCQNILRMLYFTTASAGEVALIEWFELEHKWKLFATAQPLPENICRDLQILAECDRHDVSPYCINETSKRYDCVRFPLLRKDLL